MKQTYSIKIIGEGNADEIINALEGIINAFKYKSVRQEMDSPEIENLDGAEWNDFTLRTEIEKHENN